MLAQRRAGRQRAPEIVGQDLQPCAGGLDEALILSAKSGGLG
jgi:hypothetical protein